MQSSNDDNTVIAVLHMFVLGGFDLLRSDGVSIPIKNQKARGLLAYLALSKNQSLSREHLVGKLWSKSSEKQARASLRQTIKSLREIFDAIGFTGFVTGRNDISFLTGSITVDALSIGRNLESGIVSERLSTQDATAEMLLYGHDGLDQEFGEWLLIKREEYNTALISALSTIIAHSNSERWNKAALALINLQPENESIQRQLMQLEHGRNNSQKAMRIYAALVDTLDREFDLEPERETTVLFQAIKSNTIKTENTTGFSEDSADIDGAFKPAIATLVCVENHKDGPTIPKRGWHDDIQSFEGVHQKISSDQDIALFDNPLRAIEYATHIQQSCAKDHEIPHGSELLPKVSLCSVQPNPDESAVFSDNMHIALGLLKHTNAGEIITTAGFSDQLSNTTQYQLDDLGFINIRNIARRIRIYLLSPEAGKNPNAKRRQAYLPSVAVLPFKQQSTGEGPSADISTGMVYEIVALLASLKEVFVVSSTSTFGLDTSNDIAQSARALGVRYIVSGYVSIHDEALNIIVELTDTDNNQVIWADRYHFNFDDLFKIQAEISSKVAFALLPQIQIAELRRVSNKPPNSLDAYECLISGINQLYKLTTDGFNNSKTYFTKATDIDPAYANSYAWQAKWCILQIGEGRSDDLAATSKEALKLANKALAHDSMDPLALGIFGHTQSFLFANYDSAIEAFDKGILSSPNSAIVWGLSAPTYYYIGEYDTAIERTQKALSLSPLEPYTYFYYTTLTAANFFKGNYDDSIYWGRKTFGTSPWFIANLRPYIASLAANSEFDEAKDVVAKLMDADPSFRVGEFSKWYPIQDEQLLAHYVKLLIKAGLPE